MACHRYHRFEYQTKPYQGPLAEEVLEKRRRFLGPSLFDYYQKPGIGNGLPLDAIVTTPEIASLMAQKIQFNTFGGNPVCSAGGLVVLRVIDQEKHQDHCTAVGSHLLGRLRDLQQRYDSNFSLTTHLK